MEQIQLKRSVPVRYQCDVLVLGGGIAGVSAACAAAAGGSKAVLVEQYAITGGNCTAGGVAGFCGETSGQGKIFNEIVARLEAFQAIEPYHPYRAHDIGEARTFNHRILEFVLQEMLVKYGVKLLLHARFVEAAVSESGRITECVIHGKSGLEAVRAKVFIDATGEGEVAARAGFATMKGDPEKGLQLPMSMMFFVRYLEKNAKAAKIPEGYFERIEKAEELPMVSIWPNGNDGRSVKVKIPFFDSTDTESMSEAEIYARRRCFQILEFMQRADSPVLFDHTRVDENGNLVFGKGRPAPQSQPVAFDSCSFQIGIREGRRVVGDYILSVDDVKRSAEFDDAIARGTFYLDVHTSTDDKRAYVLDQKTMYTDPYQIPLRSLICRDGENLLVAGRCFSVDQLALGTARVTTTSSMMGQAAGITASLAASGNCRLRDVDPGQVRNAVVECGGRLEL